MADIVNVELQAVSGGLQLVQRTLQDILNRVTVNPGPIQTPAAIALLGTILASTQTAAATTQQLQAIANPTGGGGGPVPGTP